MRCFLVATLCGAAVAALAAAAVWLWLRHRRAAGAGAGGGSTEKFGAPFLPGYAGAPFSRMPLVAGAVAGGDGLDDEGLVAQSDYAASRAAGQALAQPPYEQPGPGLSPERGQPGGPTQPGGAPVGNSGQPAPDVPVPEAGLAAYSRRHGDIAPGAYLGAIDADALVAGPQVASASPLGALGQERRPGAGAPASFDGLSPFADARTAPPAVAPSARTGGVAGDYTYYGPPPPDRDRYTVNTMTRPRSEEVDHFDADERIAAQAGKRNNPVRAVSAPLKTGRKLAEVAYRDDLNESEVLNAPWWQRAQF